MTEETFYLIDFENVGLKGLEGAEKLTRHDHVYLFSTRNAPKIDTATLSTFNNTNFEVHEVPAKSQSLDMHLVSYLGFLLGKYIDNPKLTMRVVIISNDTDYDDVAQFWNRRLDISVSRRERFHPEAAKAATLKIQVAKLSPVKKQAAEKNAEKKKRPEVKKAAEAAPEITPAAPEKTPAPDKNQKKVPAQKITAPADKTAVNNAVMKTLSAEKYDNEIVGFVASQVTKLFSEKNGKQQIYRSIISKYGQERGLEIYRNIKKII